MILVTMKWLYIILMTVSLLHCNCKETHMPCPSKYAYGDEICIGTTACNTNATYFTWINYLNSEAGNVTLEFDSFQNFCVGRNKLILQVSEMATEGTCKSTGDECDSGSFEDHSTRYVRIKKNQSSGVRYPSCEKRVNITFNFIYKSCYRLKIEPEDKPASCSLPTFLATKFTKEEFSKRKNPQVISSYDKIQNHMVHTVRVDKLQTSIMELMVRECDKCDSCKSTINILHQWTMAPNGTGDYICKVGEENSNCTLVGGDTIKCITENINNHAQCLVVELLYHPCEGNGVWDNTSNNYNKTCQWSSLLETPSQLIEVSTPADEDQSVFIILTSIFFFLGTVCFCILLYIVRKKIGKWFHYSPSPPPSSECIPVLSSVLLLYSRDCKPFMDLMNTFRNMLKEVMKCKVYDCFDPDLAEEVAKGGVEWLNKHVSCDDMKIVVVESECAVFRQKELFQGNKIGYQNPTWLDDIFIHGLKELSYDKRSNQYDRVFIVCVRGFTDGNARLGIITPNTRYVIPQHLEELMTSLYRHTNLEYTEHLQVLKRDIRNLEEYKKNNEDYLNQLLFRTT